MSSSDDILGQFGEEFSAGKGFKKALRLPAEGGTLEAGVLTQMGDARNDPEGWHAYQANHWGYKIRRKDDPSKLVPIKISCLKRMNPSTRAIIEDCELCVEYDKMIDERKATEAQFLGASGSKKDEAKLALQPINSWLRTFNVDRKQVLFAFTPNGEFNKLEISGTLFKDLRAEMNKFQETYQKNPRSPRSLVMWLFERTGNAKKGEKVTDKVKIAEVPVTVDGEILNKKKVLQLTEDQLRKALAEYSPLNESDAYVLTHEQMRALIESGADPEVVETIVGQPQKVAQDKPAARPAPAASVAPMTVPNQGTLGTTVTNPATAAAPAPAKVETKTEAPPPVATMSKDDIFARIGLSTADLGIAKQA